LSKIAFPKLIAHRGASTYAPENTLASLRKAAELGVSWVECDVALSACGQTVIMHDSSLNRTTNGKGEVAKTSYELISQLDAGGWFAPEFKDERVPTLDQWLSCTAALDLGLNLELKGIPSQADQLMEKVLASLKLHWSEDYANLCVSSFSLENLEAARRADAKLPLGLLSKAWSEEYGELLDSLSCTSINLAHQSLDERVMRQIAAHNVAVLAYTVDDKKLAEHLFELGVCGVFTNDPCLLKEGG